MSEKDPQKKERAKRVRRRLRARRKAVREARRKAARTAKAAAGKTGAAPVKRAIRKFRRHGPWMYTSLVISAVVIVVVVAVLSMAVSRVTYNSIQTTLDARSEELGNVFSEDGRSSPRAFSAAARQYVENFPNKESMELMVFNANGKVINTSLGFTPPDDEEMPDYTQALESGGAYGTWTGKLSSGEKVMAVTRVIRSDEGSFVGAVRYVVSLQRADRQIFFVICILCVAGVFIAAVIVMAGRAMTKKVLQPIEEISLTAKRIAHGDFEARIGRIRNDEIGDLCQTINEMAQELGTAEKMKNDFISSVSHELRTPLTAIKGWGETLEGGGLDPESFRKGMDVILHETERLSGRVEDLLDFSRMQSGRMTMNMQRLDILAELGEAVYMFSERAKNEGKFLLYEEPEILSPVLGDVNRLRQVFVNILDNALKYTDKGGTITVTAAEADGFIQVLISDSGCGIAPEHLPKIKEKFYKANQTVRGSGIGLAVADEIMRLHSGSLEVDSTLGVGTAVTITIPTLEKLQEHYEEAKTKLKEEVEGRDDDGAKNG